MAEIQKLQNSIGIPASFVFPVALLAVQAFLTGPSVPVLHITFAAAMIAVQYVLLLAFRKRDLLFRSLALAPCVFLWFGVCLEITPLLAVAGGLALLALGLSFVRANPRPLTQLWLGILILMLLAAFSAAAFVLFV